MNAFLYGLVYEIAFLAWLYFASAGKPVLCATLSAYIGYVSFKGFCSVIADQTQLWYLLGGYAAGSFIAAKWKHATPA